MGAICSDSAMISISAGKERFSHDIIKGTGEFVINLVNKKLVRVTDCCGAKFDRGADKFAETRLTPQEFRYVKTSGIEKNPVSIKYKVVEIKELGSHDIFIAKVVGVTIDNQYMDDRGKFNPSASGLVSYSHGEHFKLGKELGSSGYSMRKIIKRRETSAAPTKKGRNTFKKRQTRRILQ